MGENNGKDSRRASRRNLSFYFRIYPEGRIIRQYVHAVEKTFGARSTLIGQCLSSDGVPVREALFWQFHRLYAKWLMGCTMVDSATKCLTYTRIGDGDFASPPASGSGCPGVGMNMYVLLLLTSNRRIFS